MKKKIYSPCVDKRYPCSPLMWNVAYTTITKLLSYCVSILHVNPFVLFVICYGTFFFTIVLYLVSNINVT